VNYPVFRSELCQMRVSCDNGDGGSKMGYVFTSRQIEKVEVVPLPICIQELPGSKLGR
jgi:hypothetical protein